MLEKLDFGWKRDLWKSTKEKAEYCLCWRIETDWLNIWVVNHMLQVF